MVAFQFIPLSRGETIFSQYNLSFSINFNPLPSHEGRRTSGNGKPENHHISIHSPLTRGDWSRSTYDTAYHISIHSPLTRGDETHYWVERKAGILQSTPLSRGETLIRPASTPPAVFFNPLPSHEGRPLYPSNPSFTLFFNPLPSHEGRRRSGQYGGNLGNLQSTPLSRGETVIPCPVEYQCLLFNPLPSHEGRRHSPVCCRYSEYFFNPLPSHEGRLSKSSRIGSILTLQSTPLSRGETFFAPLS